MNEQRILGNNVKVLLRKRNVSEAEFAKSLGYSANDMMRFCEGRLYSDREDVKDIALFFHMSVDELLERKTDDEYMDAECIHYNHKFKEEKNLDTILDLFDVICDIKEAL